MRELLEAPELDVKDILTRYSYYWATIDYSSREADVREYWGKSTPTTLRSAGAHYHRR